MDKYHLYYIYFYISIRIRIWIVYMPDGIQMDSDIINIRFKYSNTDTVSDFEHPDSDTNKFGLKYGQKISIPFSPLLLLHESECH